MRKQIIVCSNEKCQKEIKDGEQIELWVDGASLVVSPWSDGYPYKDYNIQDACGMECATEIFHRLLIELKESTN